MNRVPAFGYRLLFLILASLLLGAHEAQAKRGIVIITHGDAVSEIGPVKKNDELLALFPLLKDAKIGFHYNHFGIFWLDLWNWGGEYVIYNSAKEGEVITKEQAAMFLGVPESEIGTPLNYKAPYGLDILIGLGLLRFVPRFARRNNFGGSGSDTGRAPARVETDRPRWVPPAPRTNPAPPLVFQPGPVQPGSGPPPIPPPLPPEQP
jgi:hypothetical protein